MGATRGVLVVTKLKFSSNSEARGEIPHHLPRPGTTHTSALQIFYRAWRAQHPLMPSWLLVLNASDMYGSLLQVNSLFPQDLPSKHTASHTTFQLLKPGEGSVQNRRTAQWSQVLWKSRIKFKAAHFLYTHINYRELLQLQLLPHHDSYFHYYNTLRTGNTRETFTLLLLAPLHMPS